MSTTCVRATLGTHFASLARVAPRTADAAFEAVRHANRCGGHLDAAGCGVQFLRDLIGARVTVEAPRLFSSLFSDNDPHERLLENKTRTYAELCATVEVIEAAFASAQESIDRMGRASVRVMRDLSIFEDTDDARSCRAVIADLVANHRGCIERMIALRNRMAKCYRTTSPSVLQRHRGSSWDNAGAT